MKRPIKNVNLVIGGTLVLAILVTAGLSFFYTPYDPNRMNMAKRFQPPGAEYLLGTVQFAIAILAEAALSYLGLGTQPPHASWGRMLNEAQTFMEISPWLAIFPGLAIARTVLGFNLLGDGLRDLLDPKLSRARR